MKTKTKTKTLNVNGRVFVANDSAMIDSLFKGGSTAFGYFKKYKRGIELRDIQGEPFAYLCAQSEISPFWVSASKTSKGKTRYSYGFSELDASKLGLDVMEFSEIMENAKTVWEDSAHRS